MLPLLLLLCDDDNIYAMPKPTALWRSNLLRAMCRTHVLATCGVFCLQWVIADCMAVQVLFVIRVLGAIQ
jgi:hypothetical protein